MKIPQFKSNIDKIDYQHLEKVFENNYVAEGPFSKEFHVKLLEIINADYGCFASNGTLALYLALKALEIGPGDEVVVQNTTFIASANAVEMTGAKPVFVDVLDYDDLSLDLAKVKITEKTKAIMVAHLFGTACTNIEMIRRFCDDHNLYLVEDAAQALGIKSNEKHCGTFGHIGTFSFYADKTITTGEGGFVVTNEESLHKRMLYLRNQGRIKSGTFIHPEIGYNFRITDMQGALGLSQLKKLDHIIKEKLEIRNLYKEYLNNHVHFLKIRDDFTYIPFRVVIFTESAHDVMKFMSDRGIEARTVFYPLHSQPCYEYLNCSDDDYKNSMDCYEKGICLPTWVGLSKKEIQYVCDIVKEAINKK